MNGASHDAAYAANGETICPWIEHEVRYTPRVSASGDEVRHVFRMLLEARAWFRKIEDQEVKRDA
jgi:hypothetical protein